MIRLFSCFLAVILLTACSGLNGPIEANPPAASPSQTPAILSPTPVFIPTVTPTSTLGPTVTPVATITSTDTAVPVISPTSTTAPSQNLDLEVLSCNTSIDILHQMGEVTNAYPLIRNVGVMDVTDVCATLSASDEAREHPDKTHCVPSLPVGFQVVLKLTVDTGFQQDTSITIKVTTHEDFSVEITKPSCREIRVPGWAPENISVIQPIP